MAQFETWLKSDLQQPVKVIAVHGNVFTQDNMANRIGVKVYDGGTPVTLEGSVTGLVIRSDDATVLCVGELDGNAAWFDMPESAYAVPGLIQIAIRLAYGDTKTVLGACTGYVTKSSTDTIVDPGEVIPDFQALLERVLAATEAAETATTAANTAAEKLEDMDATATTLAAGASATASISTVSGHYRIALGIPAGAKGDTGATGAQGPAGPGVPAGGTTGQVLKKASGTDYDTAWANESGGGGTGDYTDLTNKPQINSVTLSGNKSLSDLGAASAADVAAKYTKPSGGIPATDIASGVIPDVSGKLDAPSVAGTNGQVLTSNGQGGQTWEDPQGGGSNITDTASGAIASFPDGADGEPMESVRIKIEPVQSGSGTPSSSNVRPISGWTGANVYRAGKNAAGTFEIGSVSEGQPAGSTYEQIKLARTNRARSTALIPTPAQFTVSMDFTNYRLGVVFYDKHQKYLGASNGWRGWLSTAQTWTPSISAYVSFVFKRTDEADITSADYTNCKLQLEFNAAATDYEPYVGTTYPITWTQAGTVYGGELDVTNGTLTVDSANISSYAGETLPGEWISDRDAYAAGTTPTTGAQVVYKLATPVTYQLTPTQINSLLGQNNVWADTGDTAVTYMADTQLYIDKKAEEAELDLSGIIAPEEATNKASQSYAVGSLLIYNETLYKVTSSISSGGTITPGSNVTATTMEEIAASKATVSGTPSNGDFLVYSSSAGAWVPTTMASWQGGNY